MCFVKAIALLVTLGVFGCGNSANGPAVVRVGPDAIGERTVTHWAHVIERGGMLGESSGGERGAPRERALDFLISSTWLAGEAERLGLAVPSQAVDRGALERSAASGDEFDERLHSTGQTAADVKQEVRAELTLAAIRGSLAKRAAQVTDDEVAAFYQSNRRMFIESESRDVDLIETLPSRAAALALVRRVGGGSRFAKKAFHEKPSRASIAKWKQLDKKAVLRAIFATRPGVVSRPMRLGESWIVFVVRRIIPASLEPLAKARGKIVQILTARRHAQITAQFDREYKAHWTARTSCRPGYVVQGCAQYNGPIAREENPFAVA